MNTEETSILIVDDEPMIGKVIREFLLIMGFSVAGILNSGEEAVEFCKETIPDLILMDIHLKGIMNGIDTAIKIRNSYDVPVVFLTACLDDNVIKRTGEAGFYGYISKPIEFCLFKISILIALSKARLEKKLKRFSTVLTVNKHIWYLLKHADDPIKLIDGICDTLWAACLYNQVWFFLSYSGEGKKYIAVSGATDESKKEVLSHFYNEAYPACHYKAMESGDVIVETFPYCEHCHYADSDKGLYHIAIPVKYKKQLFGTIHFHVDKYDDTITQELDLLKELADNVAFSMYSYLQEQEK